MKKSPFVEKFMTPTPHTINSSMPLKTARAMMKKYGVRHLPVQLAGHLVGVVSDRDLKLALSFKNMDQLFVDDVMTPDPYSVSPRSGLDEVVNEMSTRRYGCAVIQNEKGNVLGIFTATDGLRVLGKLLHANQKAVSRKKGVKK